MATAAVTAIGRQLEPDSLLFRSRFSLSQDDVEALPRLYNTQAFWDQVGPPSGFQNDATLLGNISSPAAVRDFLQEPSLPLMPRPLSALTLVLQQVMRFGCVTMLEVTLQDETPHWIYVPFPAGKTYRNLIIGATYRAIGLQWVGGQGTRQGHLTCPSSTSLSAFIFQGQSEPRQSEPQPIKVFEDTPCIHGCFEDVTFWTWASRQDFNVLARGPPCHPFSRLNEHKGFNDSRGRSFFHVAIFGAFLRTQVLGLENVASFIYHDEGRMLAAIHQPGCADGGTTMRMMGLELLMAWTLD